MKAKRAMLTGPRRLEFEEIDVAGVPLGPQAVLARTLVSAVSTGTEVAAYTGEPPLRPGPIYPRKVGYCNVGEVLEVGAAAENVAPGQRILTAQSHQSAFVCAEGEVFGIIPEGVGVEAAALSYLAHLGLAALETTGSGLALAESRVAVLGLGVIGLATICLAAGGMLKGGAAEVVAIGNDTGRLRLAQRLGARRGYLHSDPTLLEEAPDVIVTTANPWSAWQLVLELARFRTRIAVLGFPGRSEGAPEFNPLGSEHFYNKQLSIQAAGLVDPPGAGRPQTRLNIGRILGALAGGRLPLAELITHRVPWHQLGHIYELAASRDKSLVAAILDWRTDL